MTSSDPMERLLDMMDSVVEEWPDLKTKFGVLEEQQKTTARELGTVRRNLWAVFITVLGTLLGVISKFMYDIMQRGSP